MFTNKAQERVLYFCCDTYYGQMYQIFFCVGRLILFFLKKIKIKRSPASWQPRRPLHLTNHNSHSCTLEHQTHRQMQQWNLGSNFCWCHQRAKKLQEHQKVSLSSSSSIVSLQKGLQEHKEKKKTAPRTNCKVSLYFVLSLQQEEQEGRCPWTRTSASRGSSPGCSRGGLCISRSCLHALRFASSPSSSPLASCIKLLFFITNYEKLQVLNTVCSLCI